MEKEQSIQDHLLRYVTDGYMPEEVAQELMSTEPEERSALATMVSELTETALPEGQTSRARWLGEQLAHGALTEKVTTVFIQTVSERPRITPGEGMGDRPFTGGRHSSPFTSGW